MSKINSTNKVFKPETFWPSISEWLSNVASQQDFNEHRNAVHQWYDAFILSYDADDQELRHQIMLQRNNLLDLFTILEQYPPNDRIVQLQKYDCNAA